eukprot:1162129-Pelagomonas_calceolata.AAC.5
MHACVILAYGQIKGFASGKPGSIGTHHQRHQHFDSHCEDTKKGNSRDEDESLKGNKHNIAQGSKRARLPRDIYAEVESKVSCASQSSLSVNQSVRSAVHPPDPGQ